MVKFLTTISLWEHLLCLDRIVNHLISLFCEIVGSIAVCDCQMEKSSNIISYKKWKRQFISTERCITISCREMLTNPQIFTMPLIFVFALKILPESILLEEINRIFYFRFQIISVRWIIFEGMLKICWLNRISRQLFVVWILNLADFFQIKILKKCLRLMVFYTHRITEQAISMHSNAGSKQV